MARKRDLRPSFFTNEYLAELPFEARLLFAGLWTIADRRGRLEDRPVRIKGALFPYDNIDVDKCLQSLADSEDSFIVRYEVGGKKYIQISNFEKNQHVHKDETESTIPAPPSNEPNVTVETTESDDDTALAPLESGGSTTVAPHEHHSNTPSSLIASSLVASSLIASSLGASAHAREGELPKKTFGEFQNVRLDEGELSGLYNREWDKQTVDAAIEWFSDYKHRRTDKYFDPDRDYAAIKDYGVKHVLEQQAKLKPPQAAARTPSSQPRKPQTKPFATTDEIGDRERKAVEEIAKFRVKPDE